MFLTRALASTALFLSIFAPGGSISHAQQCDLNGVTLVTDITECPDRSSSVGKDCVRSRTRYGIIGNKVLAHKDEVSDEGIVYEIGKRLDLMLDPVQAKAMEGTVKMPGTYIKAEATASYSSGQLRLAWRRERYLHEGTVKSLPGGTLFQSVDMIHVFDIIGCTSCRVSQVTFAVTMKPLLNQPGSQTLRKLMEQTCEMRRAQ
jgi:hypothetical protein